jgi:hypothetical protein
MYKNNFYFQKQNYQRANFFNFIFNFFKGSNKCKKFVSFHYPNNYKNNDVLILGFVREHFKSLILQDEQIPMEKIYLIESAFPSALLLKKEFGDLLDIYYVYSVLKRKVLHENDFYDYYVIYYTNILNSAGNFNENTYRDCILFHIYHNNTIKVTKKLKEVIFLDVKLISFEDGFPTYQEFDNSIDIIGKLLSKK